MTLAEKDMCVLGTTRRTEPHPYTDAIRAEGCVDAEPGVVPGYTKYRVYAS